MTQSATPAIPLALNEKDVAARLKVSLSWLQRDRRTKKVIPFYRIGGNIRYSPERVAEALAKLEEGGTAA